MRYFCTIRELGSPVHVYNAYYHIIQWKFIPKRMKITTLTLLSRVSPLTSFFEKLSDLSPDVNFQKKASFALYVLITVYSNRLKCPKRWFLGIFRKMQILHIFLHNYAIFLHDYGLQYMYTMHTIIYNQSLFQKWWK